MVLIDSPLPQVVFPPEEPKSFDQDQSKENTLLLFPTFELKRRTNVCIVNRDSFNEISPFQVYFNKINISYQDKQETEDVQAITTAPPPPPPPESVPPPPPPPGGIPPPPPPPGMKADNAKKKVKMTPFHWNKIPKMSIPKFWSENIDPSNVQLATEELEHLFGHASPKPKDKKIVNSFTKNHPTINLLDIRRSNNIGIVLSQFRIPYDGIRNAILNADEMKLSIENIEALLKYIPTEDEVKSIKKFDGDESLLPRGERFFLKIIDIPRLETKLECLLLKSKFDFQIFKIQEDVEIVKIACDQLSKSLKLRKLMEIILAIGNYLNAGTGKGDAFAFKLETLRKLPEVKATSKKKITLINYLAKFIEDKLPGLLSWPDEILSVIPAASVNLQDLRQDLFELSKQRKKLKQEIRDSEQENNSFSLKMSDFYKHCKHELDQLISKFNEVQSMVNFLLTNFGENPEETDFSLICGIFTSFIQEFEKAKETNKKAKEMAENKSRRVQRNWSIATTTEKIDEFNSFWDKERTLETKKETPKLTRSESFLFREKEKSIQLTLEEAQKPENPSPPTTSSPRKVTTKDLKKEREMMEFFNKQASRARLTNKKIGSNETPLTQDLHQKALIKQQIAEQKEKKNTKIFKLW